MADLTVKMDPEEGDLGIHLGERQIGRFFSSMSEAEDVRRWLEDAWSELEEVFVSLLGAGEWVDVSEALPPITERPILCQIDNGSEYASRGYHGSGPDGWHLQVSGSRVLRWFRVPVPPPAPTPPETRWLARGEDRHLPKDLMEELRLRREGWGDADPDEDLPGVRRG